MAPLPSANPSAGFIALTNVIILGAFGALITTTLLLVGVSATRTSAVVEQSAQARALANACAESALQKIKETGSLTNNDILRLENGNCNYTSNSQSDGTGLLSALGMVGTAVRKIQIIITTTTPTVGISSWQEVADF
jgi:hypothetical protein